MAWGASKGTADLIARVAANDEALTSLHIFQGKQFGSEVALAPALSLHAGRIKACCKWRG